MFSLSDSRALATRKCLARSGSKERHFRRCRPAPEVLEGRRLLATGISGVPPAVNGAGADQAVTFAAFAGPRTWAPETTELHVSQGQTAHLRVARATTNNAIGSAAVATIDWGDGSTTPGLIAAYAIDYVPGAVGHPYGITVAGEHTYLTPGTFVVRTTIVAADGDSTTVTSTVVATPALTLNGGLDPASDTGASNLDGITSATQPRFQGNATPNANVQLFATRHDGGVPFPIGQGVADAQGGWSVTSLPLAEGTYAITANISTADGRRLSAVAIATGSAGGPLVVDTTGPRVVGLTLNALNAQIQVNLSDNLAGLDSRGAAASNPVSLQRLVRSRANTVPSWPLSITDGGKSVLLGLSRPLANGRYTLRILAAGVRDLAGNALDGEFGGAFATGNGQPGGEFAATFQVARRQALLPRAIQQAATPQPTHRSGLRSAPGSSGLLGTRRNK
ncbi:Ig-like domain-containing protein [Singulisphaera sp. Ch08]|uniref:Ig-like domain-containing protein n=1 Tax=Singulisphaera sp. Ch08 TaxID=3120278 RepID=A0AAU7CP03_9BACT